MPFYSSFKSIVSDNKLVLIFNDHEDNYGVVKYGDKVANVSKFGKSVTYGVSVDLVTGEIKRKKVSTNDDETVLAPRHGYVLNHEIIIPSLNMHAFAKTALKFARITVLP